MLNIYTALGYGSRYSELGDMDSQVTLCTVSDLHILNSGSKHGKVFADEIYKGVNQKREEKHGCFFSIYTD